MNICIIAPEQNQYSETFIRAHIERLPGNITYLYGGYFPTRLRDGALLVPESSFAQRVMRSLASRLFGRNFSEETLKVKALVDFFKKNKIDAVLAEYGPTATRVMEACRLAQVKLIAHFHGFDAYEQSTLSQFAKQYQKLFQQTDAIVAVSKHMQQQLIKLGAPQEKVHYNPCGMDPKICFGSNPQSAPEVFLTTGRFVDKKGPHLTILAFAKVLNVVPQAQLKMVGDGPLLDTCQSLAFALKIQHAVEFLGPKTHHEVAQLMRSARCFIQHSRVAANGDSEGTPVAVEEAGGSGLPVVATRHAGIVDVVQEGITGFLVDEGDVDAMAQHMIKIAQDASLAQQLGMAAKARVLNEFTLTQTIAKLANIIQQTMK